MFASHARASALTCPVGVVLASLTKLHLHVEHCTLNIPVGVDHAHLHGQALCAICLPETFSAGL